MIRVTFYKNESPWTTFDDVADMARAYVEYAHLNWYGIVMEAL